MITYKNICIYSVKLNEHYVNTTDFLDAIKNNLDKALAKWTEDVIRFWRILHIFTFCLYESLYMNGLYIFDKQSCLLFYFLLSACTFPALNAFILYKADKATIEMKVNVNQYWLWQESFRLI